MMSRRGRLTDYFERVYVINLPYKKDRRARLEKHLAEVDIADVSRLHWVRALSGDWSPPPAYFKGGNGAWGCLQTHVRIVQDAIMDGIDNYLVLEDDVVFHERSPELLWRLMHEVPGDWGQIYLGGQHLRDPDPVLGSSYVFRCANVNRTHAFALHRRAMVEFQQHVCYAPDYIARGGWHIDHQLGLAHEAGRWRTYAPTWWMAGQEAGSSNISGRTNPRLWWNFSGFSSRLPFVVVEPGSHDAERLKQFVHFGNNLKEGTLEDIGLDACVGSDEELRKWLQLIAREAMDMQLVPGISHEAIPMGRVRSCWSSSVLDVGQAKLDELIGYPFNGLFAHALNEGTMGCAELRSSSAA